MIDSQVLEGAGARPKEATMQEATPTTGAAPRVGVHPEVARFERDFNRRRLPGGVVFSSDEDSLVGEFPNTDWSRLGLSFGLLFAMLIGGGIVVWIPVLNVVWGLAMVLLAVALPVFGARAALFRLRKGRTKSFRIVFRDQGPKWESDDDVFWKPIMDFFGL
jgi:hypothetical protein